ncbi:MAG: type 4a pilus biogenesis protein PilO [Vicinamibacterales bacterium]
MNLSLSKLPWYGQVGTFVALSAAAMVAFYFLHVSPKMAEAAEKRQRLEILLADIRKGQATARKLPEFRRQVTELETKLEGLKAVLPEEKDMAELLRRLHTLAMQSNLTIREFRPATAPVVRQMHAEWPINLQLEGGYHNLGIFFDRISKFSRIVNIANLQVKARDRQEPNQTIVAQCVATTFVLIDPARQPPAPQSNVKPGEQARGNPQAQGS